MDVFHNIEVNSLTLFGFILLIGVIGGYLAYTTKFFPRVTGYIIIGLLIGPSVLGILSQSLLEETKILVDLAVGLILFQLGLEIDLRRLYQNKRILITGIAECLISFAALFGTLYLFGINTLQCLIAAAIGVSSSPALNLAIASQSDTFGPVMQRSLILIAINNVLSFMLFIVFIPYMYTTAQEFIGFDIKFIFDPLLRLFGSAFLALVLTYAMILVAKLIGKRETAQFSLMAGMLLFAVGLAKMFHVSPILTPLLFGMMLINLDHEEHVSEVELGNSGEMFFIILFVYTGAQMHLNLVLSVGWIAAAYVIVRMASKFIPVFFLSKQHGYNNRQSAALGMTLLPMASMAIGLLNATADISQVFSQVVSAIVLASIVIIEVIAPVISVFAFKLVGEIDPNNEVDH